jgi:hypothetical protein
MSAENRGSRMLSAADVQVRLPVFELLELGGK